MKILIIFLLCFVYFCISFFLGTSRIFNAYLFFSFVLFVWGIIEWKSSINRINAEILRTSEERLNEIPNSHFTLSPNYLNALLINEETNTFYYAYREDLEEGFEREKFMFDKVLEVAIVEDNRILSLYPKNGLLNSDGRSITIINEVVSEADEEDEEDDDETVSKLCLKIVIDDLTSPIIEYVLIDNDKSISKESDEYKNALKICNDWFIKISIIVKRFEHDKVLLGKGYW
jgi:hypothetical protein